MSVVGGVVVGLVLDYSLKLEVAEKVVAGVWAALTGSWQLLTATYEVRGWLILFLGLSTGVLVIGVLLSFARRMTEQAAARPGGVHIRTSLLTEYTSDTIHDVKWKWQWASGEILNLRPFCPICDADLVYREDYGRGTDLICEPCSGIVRGRFNETSVLDFGNPKVVAEVRGIGLDGLQTSVKREILRRVIRRERDAAREEG